MTAHVLLCLSLASGALSQMYIPTKEIAPDVHMPVVSIGTGGLGRSQGGLIVQNWLALGGRGIDSAEGYGNEGDVKASIAKSGVPRKNLFITSKINNCNSGETSIKTEMEKLGIDYFDLLLIHFPVGDCVKAWKMLEGLYKKGTLKAIGVSNFQASDLEPIVKAASVIPHVNQIRTNVLYHDDNTIAYATSKNITIEAWSPLDGKDKSSGSVPHNPVVEAVAASHNVTGYQIALKWIVQHGHLLTFQSVEQSHQKEDADLFNFTLTDDEMSRLDKIQKSVGDIFL